MSRCTLSSNVFYDLLLPFLVQQIKLSQSYRILLQHDRIILKLIQESENRIRALHVFLPKPNRMSKIPALKLTN